MGIKINQNFLTSSLVLVLLLSLGVGIYIGFPHQKPVRLAGSLLVVCSYVGWGLYEHYKQNTLGIKQIFEYASIGLLALALVFFLIYYD